MSSTRKISVIIITKNEEENITECLESVKWADEIVVVDSGSTDKTLELAGRFTGKIHFNKFTGYAAQKSYALSKAENEWVLSLDADERVTGELKDEILNLVDDKTDGFRIRRKNYFLGKEIKGCGWDNDYQLRLFRKSRTKLTERLVHEGFVVNGTVAKLKNPILHYSYRNFHDAMIKINNYSTLEAQEKYKRKKITAFGILFRPLWDFFQYFVLRKGFRDGVYGLLVSIMHALTKTQTYIKIWIMRNQDKDKAITGV